MRWQTLTGQAAISGFSLFKATPWQLEGLRQYAIELAKTTIEYSYAEGFKLTDPSDPKETEKYFTEFSTRAFISHVPKSIFSEDRRLLKLVEDFLKKNRKTGGRSNQMTKK